MKRFPTDSFIISLLATFSTVLGCGVTPVGQATTRPFTVTGFTTLPVPMVYSSVANVQSRFPGIAANEAAARSFVETSCNANSRSALLPDAIISAILGQLSVTINYKPMSCQMSVRPEEELMKMDSPACIIVGNTVTGVCDVTAQAGGKMCTMTAQDVTVSPLKAHS
ncbi:hypothetical protein KIN20_026885 [Parelaphostrongylus tenuis]|uniref:Uncharacterized protein n=1 Tax=Parelaphostrongylus tenuis TaxID=148309 RepID=A0AAD5QYK4_PARTN|nr:hypothetical protein KIN20_026885 [Parelaphostrongylus tenuis]